MRGQMNYMEQSVIYPAPDVGYQDESLTAFRPDADNAQEGEASGLQGELPSAGSGEDREQLVLAVDFRALGAVLWLLGMGGMLICSVVSLLRLRKSLRAAVHERENIYRCSEFSTAFVYGILRPRIYLPEGLTAREEDFVLLHEQIHIRRRDPIWRLLAWTALCLHWFNPLVWLAFALSVRDMEMACDEAVLAREEETNAAVQYAPASQYTEEAQHTEESPYTPTDGQASVVVYGASSGRRGL